MKTLGLIGGIGPESTIDYYKSLLELYAERKPGGNAPPLILNSVNLKKLLDLMNAGAHGEVAEYLAREVGRLAAAGADFGLISANTPHIVFDEIQAKSAIPLISIVEATCTAAKRRGLKRPGLIGTRFTMQARFFPDVFSKAGIGIVIPEVDEQNYIHEKYFGELVKGNFLPETVARFMRIIERMKKQDGIDGVILGGTEIPLLLRGADAGIPFLDTTRIHVEAAVEKWLE